MGIDDRISLADATERIWSFAVENRQENGYACVLSAWIELRDFVRGDSRHDGPDLGGNAVAMAAFSLLASNAALNALVEFIVQTPFIGPPGAAMDAFR